MYWLLSILIITVMIAALAIASSSVLLAIDLASILIWPYLLVVAISLIIISQRSLSSAPAPTTFDPKSSPQNPSSTFAFVSQALYYPLILTLAIILVVGSGLQALSSQQRAENTKIAKSMRVQALVTIEGISDSVYDIASSSGYRQVATISSIAPLVTELSAEELDALTVEQLQASSRDNDNFVNEFELDTVQAAHYRVLLSAYPKINTSKNNLASVNELQPGDQLLMSLTLAPLATSKEAINNPTGFDSYRWLRGRHIDGVANILSVGTPIYC